MLILFSGKTQAQEHRQKEIDSTPPATTIIDSDPTENQRFHIFAHGIWPEKLGIDTSVGTSTPLKAQSNVRHRKPVSRDYQKTSSRRSIYLSSIQTAERRYALPNGLLDAPIWAESRYNPIAISPAGAAGLAQLMLGTASDLGVRNRYDPLASIDGGARYLRQRLGKFGGIHLALAAYNAGPNAVLRAKGIPLYRETRNYVKKVLSRWTALRS